MARTARLGAVLCVAGLSWLVAAGPALAADTTPPTTPIVTDDGTYTASATQLHATWSSSDPESGVNQYQYLIRQDSISGTILVNWTSTTSTSVTRTSLSLQQGKTYFFQVKARNGAALWSAVGSSNGIKVDTTAPGAPGTPTEGGSTDQDFDADGSYSVTWTAATDAESGIGAYQLQERVGAAGTWTTLTSSNTSRTVSVSGRLDKTTYFYQVRAKNGAGTWGAWSPTSDGLTVDKTAPSAVTVTDDGASTTSTTQLHAAWTASADAESGIAEYQYQIRQDSTGGTILVDWTSTGLTRDVTRTGLSLTVGKAYFVGVRAKNGAGTISAAAFSDGITVQSGPPDTTPPTGTVTINGGADSTASPDVTLTLSATDNSGTVAQMRFSNDGLTYSAAQAYATTAAWTLTAGNGPKTVSAQFKDAAGNWSAAATDTITLSVPPPPPPFQESGGQLVVEAEHYHTKTARNGKDWTAQTARAGFSGASYLTALPNTGVNQDTGYVTASPELVFTAQFTTTGTYYVWLRGWGATTSDDSVHAGADGVGPATADRIGDFPAAWTWTRNTRDGSPATLAIATAGTHTIHVWMREDGFSVDKLLLRTSSSSTAPSGTGPAENPHVSSDTTPPTGSVAVNGGAPYTSTAAVALTLSATDDSGTVAEMQFSNDGAAYSAPEPYAASKAWTLASGDGLKTVSAKFKDGTGNWSTAVSDTITLDTTPPSPVTVTDDGATTAAADRLHATWTASADPHSGVARYDYQIRQTSSAGAIVRDWTDAGTAAEVTAVGLSLTDGTSYVIGVRAANGAGLLSTPAFSDGITVQLPPSDTTPPTGSVTVNAGAAYTASAAVTLTLSATDDSGTVAQMRFSNDGTTFSAPEAYATSKSWTLDAADGAKTVSAQFQDPAGNWSASATDAITLDASPPSAVTVTDDGATTADATQLHATWTASADPHSGVAGYDYRITQGSADGAVTRDWTDAGAATQITATGLSLTVGQTYFVSVRARNGAGLTSAVGSSDGILVEAPADTTPPSPVTVTDDGATTADATQLHATWTASADPESGVARYELQIRRDAAAGPVVQDWTDVGLVTEHMATGLTLSAGTSYFIGVRAINGAGLASTPGFSDGITVTAPVDTTPPSPPTGALDDGATTTSIRQLYASWTAAGDPESGIADYEYQVRQGSVSGTIVRDWTSFGIGPTTEATALDLVLTLGQTYYLGIRARNGAGLASTAAFTDGITVAAGGTTVNGDVSANATWTRTGSPYTVTTFIRVYNSTLTIEPGVEVLFNANAGLDVGWPSTLIGTLVAQGTAARPITFTSSAIAPAPGAWTGLGLSLTTPASILDYCRILYGGTEATGAGLVLASSTPTVRHSTIRFSAVAGVRIGTAGLIFDNNHVSDNAGYAIRANASAFPASLQGNTYANNGTQAIELQGTSVFTDLRLPDDGLPYDVPFTLQILGTVAQPVTLTIDPGVTLRFASNTALQIGNPSTNPAILKAQGTAAKPITFTGKTPTPGSWVGVMLMMTTPATVLERCLIEYGGAGGQPADLVINGAGVTVRHSTFRHSSGAGVWISGAPALIEYSTMTQNDTGLRVGSATGLERIRQNTIAGNTTNNIFSTTPLGCRLSLNWWGDPAGPGAVAAGVLVEPWLSQPPAEPLAWHTASDSPDPMTPQGGRATFSGTLSQAANWTITLRAGADTIIKTLTGTGSSLAQDWDGTGAGGSPLPDGVYRYELAAANGGGAAAAAAGTVTLNAALPIANITSPAPDATLTAGPVPILGTATGTDFDSYQLEFGEGLAPTAWTLITSSTTPVTNGTLATWTIPTWINTPVWTLRLTVKRTAGPSAIELVPLRLLNVINVQPSPLVFSPDGDGRRDTINLLGQFTLPVNWTLTVRSNASTVVRTFAGSSERIDQVWDGATAAGPVAADGPYTFTLQGTDPASGLSVTSAPAQMALDTTPPTPLITRPAEAQTILTNDPLPIIGTANDANFYYYSLEYGTGAAPAFWNFLGTFYTPVDAAALFTLDPQALAPDTYTVRLTVGDLGDHTSTLVRTFQLDHIRISDVSVSPSTFNPGAGESAGIHYTIDRPADVVVRLYQDVPRQLARTLNVPGQPAGPATTLWNGATDAGPLAAPEAYFVLIDASDVQGRHAHYNNAQQPLMGTPPVTTNPSTASVNFSPYRNDRMQIAYETTAPERLTVQIIERNNQQTIPIRTLRNQTAHAAGSHTVEWDGRRDNGAVYSGVYDIFFGPPGTLPLNPIIVLDGAPAITGFRAEAYLIQPAHNEVSTMTYSLSRAAAVSINLVDPNGSAVRTLVTNAAQSAGPNTVEWDGRADDGRLVWLEGDYRVQLTATDPANGLSSTTTGNVTVIK